VTFLSPSQQCRSTEGKFADQWRKKIPNIRFAIFPSVDRLVLPFIEIKNPPKTSSNILLTDKQKPQQKHTDHRFILVIFDKEHQTPNFFVT